MARAPRSGPLQFTVRGAEQLERKLRKLSSKVGDRALAALTLEGELIVTDAKKNFVPVDLGPLRASGRVQRSTRRGNLMEVEIGFGGPATLYALEQHENADFTHTVGEDKYLEKPLMAAVPGMSRRIARTLRIEGLGL